MREWLLRLLNYYKTVGCDEYIQKLHKSTQKNYTELKKRANISNVLIRHNPDANAVWMDKFPVGTWLTDEDGHGWDKREDGRWYFYSEAMTSNELSKDGAR